MKKTDTKILTAVVAVLAIVLGCILFFIFSSSSGTPRTGHTSLDNTQTSPTHDSGSDTSSMLEITDTERRNVKVTMTDGQSFTISVYPDVAPQSAQNFLNLVRSGFYDGLTFHRIIDGFMAQGGDPNGNGMGGSDKNIVGEFAANGYSNSLSHKRGVVSMARSTDYNSASSQFFICYDDAPHLDGQYAAFGEVTEGMEVVDSFLSAGTDENDRPLKEVKIQSMTVEE